MTSTGALMVCGATSGAGKSTVTAGLCRLLARRGHDVVPFKAQNMSNHAAVTADGGEVGRAQAMQAMAAGADVERRMNPVLLKPTSDHRSHLVVNGVEISTTDAVSYGATTTRLRGVVLDALLGLRRDHSWVVAEGAGGAAEINLLDRDIVNLPLARAAGMPAVLVVDIERGGAFASAYGTIELLPAALRSQIMGVVFNFFRGDPSLLDSGTQVLEQRTGVPVLGVLPHLEEELFGVEDSLDLGSPRPSGTLTAAPVRVAALRLPHLANPSDLDPIAAESGVFFEWTRDPTVVAAADLVVIPGTRATVADLDWVRQTRLSDAIEQADTVIGICGGYQMLGRWIDDPLESRRGRVTGLGLLDVETRFEEPKLVARRTGHVDGVDPSIVAGYEIRFGRPSGAARPWLRLGGEPEGARGETGRCFGTSLHGIFDADEFRRGFLTEIATRRRREFRPDSSTFHDRLEGQHEMLADWLEESMDLDRLLEAGAGASALGDVAGW